MLELCTPRLFTSVRAWEERCKRCAKNPRFSRIFAECPPTFIDLRRYGLLYRESLPYPFNPTMRQAEIVDGERVLEVCSLSEAPRRLAHHRHQAAQASGQTFTPARAYKRERA